MSYEIKTIYRAVVPSFDWIGHMHQGWYWSRETAESVITNDGGTRQGLVWEYDAIVMGDGDVLLADRVDTDAGRGKKTTVTKIDVYGDSDEDLRAAAMERLPDPWKKALGLPYDEEKAAEQTFDSSRDSPYLRDKLLILDVTAEEARVLGLGDERTRAIEGFQEIERKREEAHEAEKQAHPLIGRKFKAKVPSKDPKWDYKWEVTLAVGRLAAPADDGETQYHCTIADDRWISTRREDTDRPWRKSEVEGGLIEEGQEARA